MLDQSLLERYRVQVGPGMEHAETSDILLELHALLLHRVLLAADPPAAELGATKALLR